MIFRATHTNKNVRQRLKAEKHKTNKNQFTIQFTLKKVAILASIVLILAFLSSCKPINIFSPLVDPSKMGNDAKLDAGYNALASGDYDEAIDYFTSVINSSSGEEKAEAYIGRASAYLQSAAPNLDDVVSDLISGNLEADSTGDIISTVVGDEEYDDFFENAQNAADDYNSALEVLEDSDVDPGVLLEAYQANMMAATGVGSQKIADQYNNGNDTYADIWTVTSSSPVASTGYGTVTYNMELEAILASDRETTDDLYHPYNITTWEDSTASNNGLYQFVRPDASAKADMMEYLSNAYNALEDLKSNPPEGMTADSINDMENTIRKWAYYGLGEDDFGIPQ